MWWNVDLKMQNEESIENKLYHRTENEHSKWSHKTKFPPLSFYLEDWNFTQRNNFSASKQMILERKAGDTQQL